MSDFVVIKAVGEKLWLFRENGFVRWGPAEKAERMTRVEAERLQDYPCAAGEIEPAPEVIAPLQAEKPKTPEAPAPKPPSFEEAIVQMQQNQERSYMDRLRQAVEAQTRQGIESGMYMSAREWMGASGSTAMTATQVAAMQERQARSISQHTMGLSFDVFRRHMEQAQGRQRFGEDRPEWVVAIENMARAVWPNARASHVRDMVNDDDVVSLIVGPYKIDARVVEGRFEGRPTEDMARTMILQMTNRMMERA